MRIFSRKVALFLLSMLAMVAVAAVPAFAQEEPESVDVTFELTIDGEVPEGRTVTLNFPGIADLGASFCSSTPDSVLPPCEDGGTYTATFFSIGGVEPSTRPFTTTAGRPLSYEYEVYSAGRLVETLASDTITPTEDTTVNVTYRPGGETTSPDKENVCFLPEGCDTNGDGTVDVGAGESVAGDQYDEDEQSVTEDQYVTGDQYVEGERSPLSTDPDGGRDRLAAVLPDTGGTSLALGILGALLVGGGVFVRRMMG